MDVSVIVPIYNVEEYLVECLDSLDAQKGISLEFILVDDGSTDSSGSIAQRYAETHDRFIYYYKDNGGLSDTRNYGIDRAHGEFIAFMDSDDIVAPGIYEKLFRMAKRDGSSIVTCNVTRFNSGKSWESGMHEHTFKGLPRKTNLAECPELVYDTTSPNKIIKREFFLNSGLRFPTGMLYEDIPVILPLYAKAPSVSILPITGYYWRVRDLGTKSITQQVANRKNLDDRLAVMAIVDDYFIESNQPENVIKAWQSKCLWIDFNIFINKLDEMSDDDAGVYIDALVDYYNQRIEPSALDGIPAMHRRKIGLLLEKDRDRLSRLCAYQKEGYYQAPVQEREGRLYAQLPVDLFEDEQADVTDEFYPHYVKRTISDSVARRGELVIKGAIFNQRVNMPFGSQTYTAWIVNDSTGDVIPLSIEGKQLGWIDSFVGTTRYPMDGSVHKYNPNGFGFRICIDGKAFGLASKVPDGEWHIYVGYRNKYFSGECLLKNPRRTARQTGGASLLVGKTHVTLKYNLAKEAVLEIRNVPATLESYKPTDVALEIMLDCPKGQAFLVPESVDISAGADLSFSDAIVPLRHKLFHGQRWYADYRDMKRGVGYSLCFKEKASDKISQVGDNACKLSVHAQDDTAIIYKSLKTSLSRFCVVDTAISYLVAAEYHDFRMSTVFMPIGLPQDADIASASVCLLDKHTNSCDTVTGVDISSASELSATLNFDDPKVTENLYEGSRELHIKYQLQDGTEILTRLYGKEEFKNRFRFEDLGIRVYRNPDSGVMVLDARRKWPEGQENAAIRTAIYAEAYERYRNEPINERMIAFESMWGQKYSCNPRALYEYIDKYYPQYECVFLLNDERLPINGSGKRVRRHSDEYYHILATAKYLVNNVNFHAHYVKRPGQIEIQTMHGTPLKTLGLEVPDELSTDKAREAFLAKTARYDYLVVQGAFMESKAYDIYAFDKTILKTGYPRTDAMLQTTEEERQAIKDRLGIPAGKKVLLYAPTWRVRNHFDMQLDLNDFKKRLGDEWVILVRLHYFSSAGYSIPADGETIFDYNQYDVVEDLYLASDALMTDYSSVMFDYALLNKPMLFFTYDLENYRDRLRGMYVDIEREAPGPLLYSHEEVMEALGDIDNWNDKYKSKLDAFKEKFLTYENPNSCEMIVQQVLKPGESNALHGE